ncbi:hypothetical protein Tco_1174940 [Tanacetum coccineum]
MIDSLIYLTSSRPDIIYLKGQPKLGLWYPMDLAFDLVAYTDSDYVGASLDRKSITRGCQFFVCRLISLQYKKQTMVANSTNKAEYVAASRCCGQVLWIQNQLLDYGYNFMHTKIYIDNENTICILKNPVFHSKTKHIKIRHHFIRDSNEKKLIQMIKIHIDKNVADLLTKAFDATAKVKTINGVIQLQALVDGKKVMITETSVRRDLQLEDAEGIECLPNDVIFEKLALMRYEKPSQKHTFYKALFSPQWKFLIHTILQCLSAKSTVWNEFSSTMASAIICLAINQKFNFYKYIFEIMMKNVDSSVKFLMYPKFVQVFLDKQVGDMSTHDEIFVTPSHIKKVFGNMKRVGKGFSGAVTPIFPTMMVQAQEEIGEASAMPTDPHHTPIFQPSTSQPQKKQSRRKQRKDTEIPQSSGPTEPIVDETANEENVPTQSNDPPLLRVNTLGSGEDRLKLNELIDLCTKLSDRVLDLETTKTAQAKEIASLKKRLCQVVSFEDEGLGDQEDASKQGGKIDGIDKDAEVTLVDETQGSTAEVSAAATITTEEITLAQALASLKSAKPKVNKVVSQKLQQGTTKPIATPTTATTKGILLQEPSETRKTTRTTTKIATTPITSSKDKAKKAEEKRNKPPTKAQQRSIMTTYLKNMAGWRPKDLKINETRAEESLKRAGDELEQEKAKKQKIDDDQEEAEMKKLMEIVPDEEEVAVNAIPLATKPPSIVDWKIIKEGKIGYYQIIRADGNSKRYSSMIQMLKSFDREDLLRI